MMWLEPLDIRFMQDSICRCFQNGESVNGSIDRILRRTLNYNNFPNISVANIKGNYYSHDNRRLYMFRVLQLKGILTTIFVYESSFYNPSKFTTYNEGRSIIVRRDETRPHTRVTTSQTAFDKSTNDSEQQNVSTTTFETAALQIMSLPVPSTSQTTTAEADQQTTTVERDTHEAKINLLEITEPATQQTSIITPSPCSTALPGPSMPPVALETTITPTTIVSQSTLSTTTVESDTFHTLLFSSTSPIPTTTLTDSNVVPAITQAIVQSPLRETALTNETTSPSFTSTCPTTALMPGRDTIKGAITAVVTSTLQTTTSLSTSEIKTENMVPVKLIATTLPSTVFEPPALHTTTTSKISTVQHQTARTALIANDELLSSFEIVTVETATFDTEARTQSFINPLQTTAVCVTSTILDKSASPKITTTPSSEANTRENTLIAPVPVVVESTNPIRTFLSEATETTKRVLRMDESCIPCCNSPQRKGFKQSSPALPFNLSNATYSLRMQPESDNQERESFPPSKIRFDVDVVRVRESKAKSFSQCLLQVLKKTIMPKDIIVEVYSDFGKLYALHRGCLFFYRLMEKFGSLDKVCIKVVDKPSGRVVSSTSDGRNMSVRVGSKVYSCKGV